MPTSRARARWWASPERHQRNGPRRGHRHRRLICRGRAHRQTRGNDRPDRNGPGRGRGRERDGGAPPPANLAAGAALTRSAVDASASATRYRRRWRRPSSIPAPSTRPCARCRRPRRRSASGSEAKVVSKQGVAIGAALSDTRATRWPRATGVDGGAGDDTLVNRAASRSTRWVPTPPRWVSRLDLALRQTGLHRQRALARSNSTSSASTTGLARRCRRRHARQRQGHHAQAPAATATPPSVGPTSPAHRTVW